SYDAGQFCGSQRVSEQAAQPADNDQHQLLAAAADAHDQHLAFVLCGSSCAGSIASRDYPGPRVVGVFSAGVLSRQDSQPSGRNRSSADDLVWGPLYRGWAGAFFGAEGNQPATNLKGRA